MPDETETVAAARQVYERMQDQALAASPLAGMGEWVTTGSPPAAAMLRGAGLTAQGAANAPALRLARKAFVRVWGFSIPCDEAIRALLDLGPLVEIGAGAGYWSAMLRAAGGDVVPTDLQVAGAIGYGFTPSRYIDVLALDAKTAVQGRRDRSVFCSWPTEGEGWCFEAAAEILPGWRLALISEGLGGRTGNPELFDLLASSFAEERRIAIPQFPQDYDELVIYRRV